MSLVFQNIDPHPPQRPPLVRGEDTLAGYKGLESLASVYIKDVEYVDCVQQYFSAGKNKELLWPKGVGVNILEDARHSSVLYICKYFVALHN
jgi:hypothetical protein